MFRLVLAPAIYFAAIACAQADVWMVKSSGVVGCTTRAALIEREGHRSPPAPDRADSEICIILNAGERLLDQPEVGVGFDSYMRVQRSDGRTLFVPSTAIAPDPGIGSISEDRPE